MTPEQFCYWLQGFSELNTKIPTQEQWNLIEAHLGTVFKKVTPVVIPKPSPHDLFSLTTVPAWGGLPSVSIC